MDARLEKELSERFPLILRDMGGDPKRTCMAWGIECGNGWHRLLETTMEKIQFVCDSSTKSGCPVQLVAAQIKEKYGTLRFYYSVDGSCPAAEGVLEDVVSAAELASSRICEVTGESGDLCVRGGWYRTLSRPLARADGYRACDEGTEEYWSELDAETPPPSDPIDRPPVSKPAISTTD